jgi:beta-fructofuranosidase
VLQSGDEETLIQYDPQEESIVIDRSRSSLDGAYNNATESGPMPLFLINEKGKENKLEALRLHIYIDNSIIEVYANDRFALSTRVYPTQDGTGMSLRIPNDVYVRFINVFSEISVNAFDRP